MKKRLLIVCVVTALLAGCGYPAFTSAMRTNDYPADTKLEMKCEQYDDRSAEALNSVVSKYYAEGWRMAMLSEYTSTGIVAVPSLICFERAVK